MLAGGGGGEGAVISILLVSAGWRAKGLASPMALQVHYTITLCFGILIYELLLGFWEVYDGYRLWILEHWGGCLVQHSEGKRLLQRTVSRFQGTNEKVLMRNPYGGLSKYVKIMVPFWVP